MNFFSIKIFLVKTWVFVINIAFDMLPESGDFLGELGDNALFGGDAATAKSKSGMEIKIL